MDNKLGLNIVTNKKKFIDSAKEKIDDRMIWKTFLNNLDLVELDNSVLGIVFSVDSEMIKIFNDHYKDIITEVVSDFFGYGCVYKFLTVEEYKNNKKEKKISLKNEKIKKDKEEDFIKNIKVDLKNDTINEKYSLSNYIESDFNKEAIKACMFTLNGINEFNPIYISSLSGLGKTHLLKGVQLEFEKEKKKTIYVNPVEFTRNISTYLAENNQLKISKLISFYSDCDLILFDDFQIFGEGNKKATINFIFQIIDYRIQYEKPTIIASEYPLEKLKGLFDNRIITRLASGFQSQIKIPSDHDLTTILDALLEKNEFDKEKFDEKTRTFIIKNFQASIRSLEGAINRIKFYKSDILNSNYIYPVVASIFKEVIKNKENITPDLIIDEVCKYYKISKKEIVGKKRNKNIVTARHIAMCLIRDNLKISLEEIGSYFARDHSTVTNALKKKDEENSNTFKMAYNYLNNELYKIK